MDFSALLGMLGQGQQPGAAPMGQNTQPPQGPGFGLGQQLMQGQPGQTQFAPQGPQQDPSFMQRLQAMMQGGGQAQQPGMPGAQPDPNDPNGIMAKLGMAQRMMAMQGQQQGGIQNGMQNQSPMQNMGFIRNQMHQAAQQTQAQQGYLAQGGGIAAQRKIV